MADRQDDTKPRAPSAPDEDGGLGRDPDAIELAALPAEEAGSRLSFMVMRVEGALYAVDAQAVETIAPYQAPVPVPSAQSYVVGIVPLRGAVVAVLDLLQLLGRPDSERKPSGQGPERLVVLRALHHRCALAVAETLEVCSIREGDLRRAAQKPDTGPLSAEEVLLGDFTHPAGIVTVLDAEQIERGLTHAA